MPHSDLKPITAMRVVFLSAATHLTSIFSIQLPLTIVLSGVMLFTRWIEQPAARHTS